MFKEDLPESVQELSNSLQPLAKNAVTVLEKRYFTKDNNANLTEDVDGALWRVATHIAKESQKYNIFASTEEVAREYFRLMRDHRFLPNSPTIANAGTRTGQLSACFVLPLSDGLSNTDGTGIYDTLKDAQLIQQTGGGVGFSFGRVRRKGGFIKTTMGEASGVLSWADVFDVACDKLKQGGVRRGAQMLILPVDHPEIMEFIAYKSDLTKLTNFNVSVGATNEFLDKVMGVDPEPMYQLVDPNEGPINKFLNAQEVFKTIVHRAWATGEPGIVFLDRMNAHNPNPGLGFYEATNPCFAAGTMVLTRQGHFPIEQLVSQTVEIWDGTEWRTIDNFRVTNSEPISVYELVLSNGETVVATAYHKFILENGSRKELKDLVAGDRLMTHNIEIQNNEFLFNTKNKEIAVVSVNFKDTIEKVYCCTVEGSHAFALSNGLLVGQCGEQPLVPYESCNLGSITLDSYVLALQESMSSKVNFTFDWSALEQDIYSIIAMMDDTIDANEYVSAKGHNPGVSKIKEVTLQTRKLGLGIMGMARMLFKLGLPYNSAEGRALCEKVYGFIDLVSKRASIELAKTRGMFPYMQNNLEEVTAFYKKDWTARAATAEKNGLFDLAEGYRNLISEMELYGVRNSTTTTIAPTGTISIIHDTSGGCEPQFALVISRNQAGIKMHEADKVFAADLVYNGFSEAEIEHIFDVVGSNRGSLQEALPDLENHYLLQDNYKAIGALSRLAEIYVVAGDVSPEDHVRMQAALQQYCDSAISKTVNFPNEATEEDVAEVYRLAIELGCKGVTVYRDGSRSYQPLTAGDRQSGEVVAAKDQEIAELKAKLSQYESEQLVSASEPRERSPRLYGFNERITTGDGKLYATVGYDNYGIREVIVEIGKAGGVLNGLVEAIGRLISLALKYHVPVKAIAAALRHIRSANPYGFGANQILSIPDAIGKLLQEAPAALATGAEVASTLNQEFAEQIVPEPEAATAPKVTDFGESPECPNCNSPMRMGEGCKGGTCTNPVCGYAKC